MGRRPLKRQPAFTKIIVTDVSKKLLIPAKFVRLHRETLSRRCILRPTGTQDAWRVRTKQIDDSLYFKKGWKKFARHYSLGFGDLLVFRYAQDCEFHVDMFDKSCCFKEPAADNSRNVGSQMDTTPIPPSQDKEANFETAALEAAEEFMANSKFTTFNRVMRSAYVTRVCGYMPLNPDFAKIHFKDSTREVKIEVSGKTWTVGVLRDRRGLYRLTKCWSHLATEKALKVGDVCVFELINTKDYTLKLTIFSSTSVEKKEKWQTKARPHKALEAHSSQALQGSRRHSTSILRGHEKKANPRTLALDEVEEADKSQNVGSQMDTTPIPLSQDKEANFETTALEEAEEFMANSNFTTFNRVMRSAYVMRLGGYMPLKQDFAKMHFKDSTREVKIEVSGKTWSVGVLKDRSTGIYRLTKCWGDLATEKALKVGDVCVFELINTQDYTLKLTIFSGTRKNEKWQTKERPGKALEAHSSQALDAQSRQALEARSRQALEADDKFSSLSKKPSITYLRGLFLHVPEAFVKQMNATSGANKVKLQSRGKEWSREWDAVLYVYPNYSRIITGWPTFAKENSLQIGDACVLELIDREAALIRVTICECID